MASDIPAAFQKELTCLVCLNYLLDPVTLGCGHSFCWCCLCVFWDQAEEPARCPVCRQQSEQTNLKTNLLLKNLVSIARNANLFQFLKSEEQWCGTHKEIKEIFCDADKSLLCLLCSQADEHGDHRHLPTEEAAEEYWERLANQMRSLWEKIQEIDRSLQKNSQGTDSLMFYAYQRGDMMRKVYQMVPPLFQEEEIYYFDGIIKEGQKFYKLIQKRQEEMIGKKTVLRKIYKELMNMCNKPDVELLQELGDKLMRSEAAQLHIPRPLLPELHARPMSGLMDWLNHFKVKISFSNEVSNQHIRVFDDVRSLKYRDDGLYVSLDASPSKYFAAWGTRAFTSGKQYWEVDVDSSWDWAVGVCRDSWLRKFDGLLSDSNRDSFLLVCVKEDNHYRLWATAPTTPLYIQKPVGRVGMFLDFHTGSLSFVDVARRSLIWRYEDGVFTFPVKPFTCTGHL
uniref:Tripartite motif-containing protein 43-like n=1 Tax=Sus scrofa TaxID=9823 RepID=A0A8D0MJ77_PIG